MSLPHNTNVKRYFNHIKLQTPHARRQHSVHIAGVFTALAFVVWLTTLGMRFGATGSSVVTEGVDAQQSQLANVLSGTAQGGNTLEVVGSTETNVYSNYGTE